MVIVRCKHVTDGCCAGGLEPTVGTVYKVDGREYRQDGSFTVLVESMMAATPFAVLMAYPSLGVFNDDWEKVTV